MKVAIYLRVSTTNQATKGNTNKEGFSIPAQREACRNKAESINATLIKEYADRGESARSAARPGLQKLLDDLCSKKGIKFVIVHKIDRLARNLHDDVMIGLAIKKAGAQLISVTENIDETPSGQLLHGIMASIAEFYSRNLAAEALKGATEKAKQGGTPFQAPIGYVNVTKRINRREVRTVELDPTRAPLIRWAFEQYATGEYSERRLGRELERRGLRTRVRARSVVEPISGSGLNKLLRNRYYLGYLTYCGVEYKGRHQPLVTPSVFAAVQAVRESHYVQDKKHRSHFHYLSRLLLCGRCGRHLCYSVAKKKYGYFACLNRKDNMCDLPYVPVKLAEEAVSKELNKIKLSAENRKELGEQVAFELESEVKFAENDVKQQRQRHNRLVAEKENVMQAFYDKVIPASLLKTEQKRIARDTKQAEKIIKDAEKRLGVINHRRDKAIDIVNSLRIADAYDDANNVIKRHFCKAFFTKASIEDNRTPKKQHYGGSQVEHNVKVTHLELHTPVNVRHITEAILAVSLKSNEHRKRNSE